MMVWNSSVWGVETGPGSLKGLMSNAEGPVEVGRRNLSSTDLHSFIVCFSPLRYQLPPFGSRMANPGLGSCKRSIAGGQDCRKS